MEKVLTDRAPIPAGHYSQAIVNNGIIYISGQLPIDPKTGEKLTGSIEIQTRQTLLNLREILLAANSDPDQVLKTTVYISDIQLWDDVNKICAEFFGEHKPARAIVPTRDLHFGFKIEIEAIARVKTYEAQ